MDQSKTCPRCRTAKARAAFGPSKRTLDGLFPWCRECKRASDRASHARHRQQRSVARAEAYRANPGPYKARAAAAYAANPEAAKAKALAWAAANPERRRQIRLASQQRRYVLDPERKREVWRRRHAAVKRGVRIYGFTSEQVAGRVAVWGGRCWVCSAPYEAIDHVKPLAKGGAHMLANLRPICTACNTRKRDTWPYPAALLRVA